MITRFAMAVGVAGILAIIALRVQAQTHASMPSERAAAPVDGSGNLHVPDDYRTSYDFLGTWAVAGDQGQGAKELHSVYASPGAISAYRSKGNFPDGSVLVKEVYAASTGQMTTGTVSHSETLKGWFVMIKDDHGRHPENKLWGDGWGWSWFDEANRSMTTSTDYKVNCRACHVPARITDWIYVGGYPSLKQ